MVKAVQFTDLIQMGADTGGVKSTIVSFFDRDSLIVGLRVSRVVNQILKEEITYSDEPKARMREFHARMTANILGGDFIIMIKRESSKEIDLLSMPFKSILILQRKIWENYPGTFKPLLAQEICSLFKTEELIEVNNLFKKTDPKFKLVSKLDWVKEQTSTFLNDAMALFHRIDALIFFDGNNDAPASMTDPTESKERELSFFGNALVEVLFHHVTRQVDSQISERVSDVEIRNKIKLKIIPDLNKCQNQIKHAISSISNLSKFQLLEKTYFDTELRCSVFIKLFTGLNLFVSTNHEIKSKINQLWTQTTLEVSESRVRLRAADYAALNSMSSSTPTDTL